MRVHILTDQISGGGYGGGRGLGRGRLTEGCRNKVERCTVKSVNWRCRFTKLFAIIYLNLEIYYIVRGKLSNIFSYYVLANNVIHRTDAVHV